MFIRDGHIYRCGSALMYFGAFAPDLLYPLRCEDGKPATGDYTGPGQDLGDRVVLGDASNPSAYLGFYTVGEATAESVARLDGWLLAMRQARRTAPKDERLLDGWHEGCRAIDALPETRRAERRRVLRAPESRVDREAFVRGMLGVS